MIQPLIAGCATLIPERANEFGGVNPVGDDHSALGRGDLLIGIERKHTDIPQRPCQTVLILRTERLARILNNPQVMLGGDRLDRVIVSRLPEDIDGQQGSKST